MIRIDLSRDGAALVMRVAGTVAGPDVAVLHDIVVRHGVPARIDLSEVEFLDGGGRSALIGLEGRGATIVGLKPYVELLLRASGSGDTATPRKPE